MAIRRGRAPSGSAYSVISIVCGSIFAILFVPNSQKIGTPLLLIAIPYGCESAVGTCFKSIFPVPGSSLPTILATCSVNHSKPCLSNTAVCGSSPFGSGILYSVTAPVRGSSLPMYPLKFPVNQIFPSRSATSPCGPESSIFSAYSLNAPVEGSSRPILLTICSVNQSAPSCPTAGSCGCVSFLTPSLSRIVTFSSLTSVPGPAPCDARAAPRPRIAPPKIICFLLFITAPARNPWPVNGQLTSVSRHVQCSRAYQGLAAPSPIC